MKAALTILTLSGLVLAGCTGPEVATDGTPPGITLTAFNQAGNPMFRSSEGPDQPRDACADFASLPARFALSVADAGGVQSAEVHVFPGQFDPTSVAVGPGAPESTVAISSSGSSSQDLTVTLSPPSPGTVRTGLLILFDVQAPGLPVSLNIGARDTHGNFTSLYQVDARQPGDGVGCRGGRGNG